MYSPNNDKKRKLHLCPAFYATLYQTAQFTVLVKILYLNVHRNKYVLILNQNFNHSESIYIFEITK